VITSSLSFSGCLGRIGITVLENDVPKSGGMAFLSHRGSFKYSWLFIFQTITAGIFIPDPLFISTSKPDWSPSVGCIGLHPRSWRSGDVIKTIMQRFCVLTVIGSNLRQAADGREWDFSRFWSVIQGNSVTSPSV